jgi:two-component system, NtrC family, response regulator GlrR
MSTSLPMTQGFRLEAEGQAVEVHDGAAQIGVAPGSTLVLTDPSVSRLHCEVVLREGRVLVRDLDSTNGTRIGAVRVREAYLHNGAVLTLGRAKVHFSLLGTRVPLEVSEQSRFGELVGVSPESRRAFHLLQRASTSDTTILIEGETGTGKTQAAEAVHRGSERFKGPFLVVDCASLPTSLMEAELFGHEKGAFTGAATARLGVFEEAKGGTVFLDEVGELPIELQPRLLRVLENREVRRLGQNQWRPVDVRIIAATHRDLRQDVNAARFREDLYFRLAVVRVLMPALRERPEDIAPIARQLLQQLKAPPGPLSSLEFLDGLKASRWPGNVRELRNYLERCVVFEGPEPLDSDSRKPPTHAGMEVPSGPLSEARTQVVERFEKLYLEGLLAKHKGKVVKAASEAEVDRVYLYRLLRKYGLKASDT